MTIPLDDVTVEHLAAPGSVRRYTERTFQEIEIGKNMAAEVAALPLLTAAV